MKKCTYGCHVIIYLLPLFIVSIGIYYLSDKSIHKTLDEISTKYVINIDRTFEGIIIENQVALFNPNDCDSNYQSLHNQKGIDELLILYKGQVICSTKKKEDSLLSNNFHDINHQLSLIHWYSDLKNQTVRVATYSPSDSDYMAVSLLNRDYIRANVGYKTEPRLLRSLFFVNGESTSADNARHGRNPIKITKSINYNYDILIEASDEYIKNERVFYILSALPLLFTIYLCLFVMQRYLRTHTSASREIKQAIRRNEFILYYQPIVNASTKQTFGLEALIRWQHPTRGLIPPNIFIPLIESLNLMNDMTDIVFSSAYEDLAKIKINESLHISINVPACYLSDSKNRAAIIDYFHKFKTMNIQLGIELTERELICDDTRLYLEEMRKVGIEILLDDFGTGQTSLYILEKTQLDYLKIDKCFIDSIGNNSVNSPVLAAIINVAKGLEIKLIAEGIEKEHQSKHLLAQDVFLHQGYLYSKPMPLDLIKKNLECNHDS
ncbi:hypothetical protein BCU68_12350 [Vibrio sp. 10N.286.49.B3]|uniref:EAL domain-containing protein n=1 Tax=Vibrio sp. 10N.286.49.B3 TaxID=1880855 RepID=UPI000C8321EA|nr:EAL domain-containing protein [Vibrio sp. 10N.286.49.B3]PMH44633.1 hypothetical protein BCU68_12350 [Vibrio sp. 10N.286.49.B3]